MFYFARCINIIFQLLLAQLVKYDVHATHKIKFIHANFLSHIIMVLHSFSMKTRRRCSSVSSVK